jgi:hypothetical protein
VKGGNEMPWNMVLYLLLAVAFGVNLGVAFMAIFAGRDQDEKELI